MPNDHSRDRDPTGNVPLSELFSTALEPDAHLAPEDGQPLRIGSFELEEKIGQGGAGSVWRARQLSTGREVAVKILGMGIGAGSTASTTLLAALAEDGGGGYDRFRREVEIVASLDHPNIAKVFESGLDEDLPYFAMELVDGPPLDVFAVEEKLSQREVLTLFQKLCEAVQHAHQNGVIHRDLKPSNILVAQNSGEPKVLDFGLAKSFENEDLSIQGRLAGTPIYMSPEQASGDGRLDTRSDVYSLGVILYRLLTGEFPYSAAGGDLAIARRVVEEEPARPQGIGAELEALSLKALAKDPAQRYTNAGALGDDISRYLDGRPLQARRQTVLYQIGKHVRRHRLAWMAAAAVLLAIAAGAVLYVGQLRDSEETQKRLAADAERERGVAEDKSLLMARLAGEMRLRLAHDALIREAVPEAIGHLAGVLRTDPTNRAAAELAGNLLLHKIWPLPAKVPEGNEIERRHSGFQARWMTIEHPSGKNTRPRPTNTLQVFDAEGRPFGAPLKHQSAATCSALSADGSLLASHGSVGQFYLWESATGQLLSGPLDLNGIYSSIGFSADGRRVFVEDRNEVNQPQALELRAPLGLLSTRHFDSPIGHVSVESGSVRVGTPAGMIEYKSGDEQIPWDAQKVLRRHHRNRGDDLIIGFDRVSLEARIQAGKSGLKIEPESIVAVERSGERFVVTRPLRIVNRDRNIADIHPPAGILDGVEEPIWLGFSPDGGTVFLASAAGIARLWDIAGKRWGQVPLNGACTAVVMDVDEPVVYLTVTSGQVIAIDLINAEPKWIGEGASAMTSLVHMPRVGRVLAASFDGDLSVWNSASGEKIGLSFAVGGDRLILPIGEAVQSDRILVFNPEKGQQVWDWKRREPLSPWFGGGQKVRAIAHDWTRAVLQRGQQDVFIHELFIPDSDPPEWFVDLLEEIGDGKYLAALKLFRKRQLGSGIYADLVRRLLGLEEESR